MPTLLKSALVFAALSVFAGACVEASERLKVDADFEGGSVGAVAIDHDALRIDFMPGGDPARGWPCWWYFRVSGTVPGETITLRLRASTAVSKKSTATTPKPLSSVWAMVDQATYSHDGRTWRHTTKGTRDGEWMIYTLKPEGESLFVAWGPPYTPNTAERFVREIAAGSSHATADELCRSRENRAVPMLRIREGDLPNERRFGVWIQARQHAWESGSSWVAQGCAEWLVSDDAEAQWLRRHAEIYIVPIMDVDNTATGNGGKDSVPQDHNRDWSPKPHWNEVAAAQRIVGDLIVAGRMDLFLDLHNPGPGDPTFFFTLPDDQLKPPGVPLRDRFIELACTRFKNIKPAIAVNAKPKAAGADYTPEWRRMSANWVSLHGNPHTVSLCLETGWNHPRGTTDGYRAVGATLAAAVREYLGERAAARK